MGVIRSTIQVSDSMTPALRSMINATNIMISNFEELQRVSGTSIDVRNITAARNEMVNAEMALQGITEDVVEMGNGINRASSQQGIFNKAVNMGNNQMNQMLGTIKRVVSAYIGVQSASKFAALSDDYVSMKARTELINDGLRTQADLQNQVFAAAHRARAEYQAFTQTTSKLGLLAEDAFKNNDELIYFAETMQKAFKVSGASTSESSNGMYQLTQAMASGRLQGDEFRSIIENAPMLAKAIEKYMHDAGFEGTLKDWSSQSLLTADVIKSSLFSAADDINAKYATMPNTFGGVFNQIKGIAITSFAGAFTGVNDVLNDVISNDFYTGLMEKFNGVSLRVMSFVSQIKQLAVMAGPGISQIASYFTPVMDKIFSVNGLLGTLFNTATRLARNQGVQQYFATMAKWAQMAVSAVTGVINMIGNMANRFSALLPVLGSAMVSFALFKTLIAVVLPLAQGVGVAISLMKGNYLGLTGSLQAATAAQLGLNTALMANPYVLTATAVMTVVAAVYSLVKGIQAVGAAASLVSDISVGGYTQAEREFAERNNLSNSGGKAISDSNKNAAKLITEERASIKKNQELIKQYQDELRDPNSALNLDTNAYNDDASKYLQNSRIEEYKRSLAAIKESENNIAYIQKANASDIAAMAKSDREMQAAQRALKDINIDTNLDFGNGALSGIADDTSKIADSVDISQENLQYMRDLADRDVINRFTTAEIKVDMTNNNTITNTNDVDGLVTSLSVKLREELAATAEGSYSF